MISNLFVLGEVNIWLLVMLIENSDSKCLELSIKKQCPPSNNNYFHLFVLGVAN